ncbi:MAG: protein kinase [Muribaculaceae bacterium]|nr:protein kinase [Muribaculaceae bacterium]
MRSKDREYKIVKELGSGSFGITYLATSEVKIGNIPTTIRFAIKEHFVAASCFRADDGAKVLTVPNAITDIAKSREDFKTEANRLKKLCHKSQSIVKVNETFEANGTAYYVMEYLDGGSPSRCPEKDAVSIVMQIADALDEIHKEHVLHLDLKPDNIVLKTNERKETYPVLIDFGISKHFDSKGRPTSSLNAKGASPGYAPQEQYAGVNKFSPKYDIYALGAVLFYLCTGKNPPDAFKISPNQQELRRELTGKVTSNVEKAILNAMKPSALERTPSIRQFCDDLMGIDFIPVLNPSTSIVECSYDKGQYTVSVDSNIGWTVYADEDWCKVTKINNNIVISVSRNKESCSRACQISVNGAPYQVSQIIRIKQDGTGTEVFPSDYNDEISESDNHNISNAKKERGKRNKDYSDYIWITIIVILLSSSVMLSYNIEGIYILLSIISIIIISALTFIIENHLKKNTDTKKRQFYKKLYEK